MTISPSLLQLHAAGTHGSVDSLFASLLPSACDHGLGLVLIPYPVLLSRLQHISTEAMIAVQPKNTAVLFLSGCSALRPLISSSFLIPDTIGTRAILRGFGWTKAVRAVCVVGIPWQAIFCASSVWVWKAIRCRSESGSGDAICSVLVPFLFLTVCKSRRQDTML